MKPTIDVDDLGAELAGVAVEDALHAVQRVGGDTVPRRCRRCRRRTAPPRERPRRRTRRARRWPHTGRRPGPSCRRTRRSSTRAAPATMPITVAAQGATKAQGAVMATRPASMPLHVIEMSGFPHFQLVQHMASDRARGRGEQRVDRDDADPQVSGAERRAGVEAHPPEGQDQRADDDVAEVVPGERPDRPVLSVLADAGSEQHRQREGGPAAGRMHDAGPGEVDRAVTEVRATARGARASRRPTPSCRRSGR